MELKNRTLSNFGELIVVFLSQFQLREALPEYFVMRHLLTPLC